MKWKPALIQFNWNHSNVMFTWSTFFARVYMCSFHISSFNDFNIKTKKSHISSGLLLGTRVLLNLFKNNPSTDCCSIYDFQFAIFPQNRVLERKTIISSFLFIPSAFSIIRTSKFIISWFLFSQRKSVFAVVKRILWHEFHQFYTWDLHAEFLSVYSSGFWSFDCVIQFGIAYSSYPSHLLHAPSAFFLLLSCLSFHFVYHSKSSIFQ